MHKNRISNDQRGQTTVEFALTLMMAMSIVLFYIQLSLMLAWSSYVQYATFMSARAYFAASKNQDDQIKRAENVLSRMVKKGANTRSIDRIPFIGRGVNGGDIKGAEIGPHSRWSPTNKDFSWLEGVRYTFRSRLFLIPMGGSGNDAKVNSVTLTSESWLGREPTVDECGSVMEELKGVFDNGC